MAADSSALGPAALRRLKKKKQKEREQQNNIQNLTKSQSVPGTIENTLIFNQLRYVL